MQGMLLPLKKIGKYKRKFGRRDSDSGSSWEYDGSEDEWVEDSGECGAWWCWW